jgi:uncharacterized protein DUF4258
MLRGPVVALIALFTLSAAAHAPAPPIQFSHHALERLSERHIRAAWVKQVLRSPDWIEPDPSSATVHRAYGSIAEEHGEILRVVYADLPKGTLVITEFFDREAARRRH